MLSVEGERMLLELLIEEFNTIAFQFAMQDDDQFELLYASDNVEKVLQFDTFQTDDDHSRLVGLVYPSDLLLLRDSLCGAREKNAKWIAEFRATINDELRWFQIKASPEKDMQGGVIWSGFLQDISEDRLLIESALYNKERLEFALEGSNDGVWDWNAINNKTFYSERSVTMLGYDIDEVEFMSTWWDEKVHPDDQPAYFSEMRKHMDGLSPNYLLEYQIQCKDGSYKWILDRGKVMEWDERGKPKRIIGTHSDISGRKKNEQTLKNSIDIIAEQNKRLLNFAHIVSHNLRNHVGNFQMTLGFLDEPTTAKEQQETIGYLRTISDSLSQTMEHLNKVVAIQVDSQKQKESLNLADKVSATLELIKGEVNAKQATIVNSVDSSLFIEHLPAYLDSILLNLLSNALKYSDPARKPVISIVSETIEGKTILRISDNGSGIDMEKYGHQLFGMYQTFHGNENATGIGLFITKNQIEALGGTVSVESTLGEGTTFTIEFV